VTNAVPSAYNLRPGRRVAPKSKRVSLNELGIPAELHGDRGVTAEEAPVCTDFDRRMLAARTAGRM